MRKDWTNTVPLGIIDERYKRYQIFKQGECTYCGFSAGEHDHVPSRIVSYVYHPDVLHMVVPACRQCNQALGSKQINTLYERALWLIGYYEMFYKKDLTMPFWSDKELSVMGPLMTDFIKRSWRQRELVEERLYHLDLLASICERTREWNNNSFDVWLIEA